MPEPRINVNGHSYILMEEHERLQQMQLGRIAERNEQIATMQSMLDDAPAEDAHTVTEWARLKAEVERLNALLAQNRLEHTATVTQLERERQGFKAFSKQVRDEVIEAKANHSLCDEGVNDFLNSLGLEPLFKRYRVTTRLFGYRDVEMEIDAPSESAAGEMVTDEDHIEGLWHLADGQAEHNAGAEWESTANLMDGKPDYEVKSVVELS